jgi:hypothetical protein
VADQEVGGCRLGVLTAQEVPAETPGDRGPHVMTSPEIRGCGQQQAVSVMLCCNSGKRRLGYTHINMGTIQLDWRTSRQTTAM